MKPLRHFTQSQKEAIAAEMIAAARDRGRDLGLEPPDIAIVLSDDRGFYTAGASFGSVACAARTLRLAADDFEGKTKAAQGPPP